MGAASDTMETALLNHSLGTITFGQPSSIYVGLCTTNPTETATNECATGTYKRMQITFNDASGSSITSGTATVTFPTATGTSWGTIYGYGLFNSSSAGTMMYYANLQSNVVVNVGDVVEFAGGAIIVTLD